MSRGRGNIEVEAKRLGLFSRDELMVEMEKKEGEMPHLGVVMSALTRMVRSGKLKMEVVDGVSEYEWVGKGERERKGGVGKGREECVRKNNGGIYPSHPMMPDRPIPDDLYSAIDWMMEYVDKLERENEDLYQALCKYGRFADGVRRRYEDRLHAIIEVNKKREKGDD